MTLTGGKRKANKSLRAWVAFVKKVQKQEKLSYKDAIHRAKQRKDKGEKWMKGGENTTDEADYEENDEPLNEDVDVDEIEMDEMDYSLPEDEEMEGGRRRRRTRRRGSRRSRRSRSSRRARSSRRSRASRRH